MGYKSSFVSDLNAYFEGIGRGVQRLHKRFKPRPGTVKAMRKRRKFLDRLERWSIDQEREYYALDCKIKDIEEMMARW